MKRGSIHMKFSMTAQEICELLTYILYIQSVDIQVHICHLLLGFYISYFKSLRSSNKGFTFHIIK
jgi:succinylglutamate desuccinylase